MSAPLPLLCALCVGLGTVAAGRRLRPVPARHGIDVGEGDGCGPNAAGSLAPAPTRSGRRARRVHRAAVQAGYPDALELVVLCVRAGHLPAEAVATALPHLPAAIAPAFAAVVERVRQGARFGDAIGELPRLLGPIAQPLTDSFAAADRYGLPLAPIVERLAADARRQRRRHTETLARQLPVRLAAPLVLCTLPSFVLLSVVPLLLAAFGSLAR